MTVIRMPIISTSVMPQRRAACTARSTRCRPGGRTPARRPSATYSSAPSSTAGNRIVKKNTIAATTCICSDHSTAMAPISVALEV